MPCRGIRGAITAEANTVQSIIEATQELLSCMVEENGLDPAELGSAIFTVTPDLTAAFPARAARALGWRHVPLLDAQEVPVPGSLPLCIRVLLHWNTEKTQDEIHHAYLRGAAVLRPDLAKEGETK